MAGRCEAGQRLARNAALPQRRRSTAGRAGQAVAAASFNSKLRHNRGPIVSGYRWIGDRYWTVRGNGGCNGNSEGLPTETAAKALQKPRLRGSDREARPPRDQ